MVKQFPNNRNVIRIVNELREYLYCDYFNDWQNNYQNFTEFENALKEKLRTEISLVLDVKQDVSALVDRLFDELPEIKAKLDLDAQAGFDGDPAATGIEEIILCYPGFFAIIVHRIANYMAKLDIPLLPRMMSNYAHSKTGIDIHPRATIGKHFFIDHGTGVVIGETSIVGDRVKIYQGVTLGGLSTKGGQKLAGIKRHPTIEDNVTIYAGATILGGNTIIGHDSTIGGNTFVIESIPANTQIRSK